MINIKINDIPVTVNETTSILVAARSINITIPTLCHLSLHAANEINNNASCRICVVEIKGRRNLAPACSTVCSEGMEIYTNTIRVIKARRMILNLMLSDHDQKCPSCSKNLKCQLQYLAAKLGIRNVTYSGQQSKESHHIHSTAILRNPAKCILCGSCVTVCSKVQTVGVLGFNNRGFNTIVGPAFGDPLDNTACTFCGQCVSVCPTGALTQSNEINRVWAALHDPSKHVVVQVAPAVRVALGEEFDLPVGTPVTGKMVHALKQLGFDGVFDTNFAADVTILEEAHELLERLKKKENLPILTSCCPGWINFIEHQFPELVDIPSTCKSPHEMFGALVKSYYAQKKGLDVNDIVVVSVMPCIAKKYEAKRPELSVRGKADVDYVITTRECALMIKEGGVNFRALSDEDFDDPMGESTGAADIFGVTGGVIEAALRTAQYWLTGKTDEIVYKDLRGLTGVKTSEVKIAGTTLRIGVASGLGNARKLLEAIKNKTEHFDAIEIMACPGGCIDGGGQPIHKRKMSNTILKARAKGLYSVDESKEKRISAQNESVKRLYDEYIGEIGGKKAHNLLHTNFFPKSKY